MSIQKAHELYRIKAELKTYEYQLKHKLSENTPTPLELVEAINQIFEKLDELEEQIYKLQG